MTFAQLTARLKNFLRSWLLALGIKEGLVECATMCIKSEVILTIIATTTTTTTTTAAATTADSGLLGQITTFFNMNRYLVSSIFSAIISNLIQIIYSLF